MDPRPYFQRTLDQLEKLYTAVTPESLTRPTPCTEFDLRTLLGHTVGAVHRIAYVGEGGRGLDVAAQVASVADDDWPGAVARVKARALAAWADDAKLDRMYEVPWGTFPGRVALSAYVMEVCAHTWDAAVVIAPDTLPQLDRELAEYALRVGEQALPADYRGDDVPFDAPHEAPEGADAYTRLAAWLGRDVAAH